jgi:hypothetical protein
MMLQKTRLQLRLACKTQNATVRRSSYKNKSFIMLFFVLHLCSVPAAEQALHFSKSVKSRLGESEVVCSTNTFQTRGTLTDDAGLQELSLSESVLQGPCVASVTNSQH